MVVVCLLLSLHIDLMLDPLAGAVQRHLSAILAPSWDLAAPCGRSLGAILGHVGAIWGHLGAILEKLGAILGCLGALVVLSWAISAPSSAILAPAWGHLGQDSEKTPNTSSIPPLKGTECRDHVDFSG